MLRFQFILFLFALLPVIPARPQSVISIRMNRIQVADTDGFRDEYGHTGGRKKKIMILAATMQGSGSNSLNKAHRSEAFRQADPWGIILTITGIAVVTISLTLLFFVFRFMGNYHSKAAGKKRAPVKTVSPGIIADGEKKKRAITNDELAAIAVALYKYSEIMHRHEEMVLTINKVSKVYSPWSSKIYGLRQFPAKK